MAKDARAHRCRCDDRNATAWLAGLAMALCAAAPARAETDQKAAAKGMRAPAANAGASAVQDPNTIVITAQKRSQTLQEAPVAVTAFTAQAMKERGINDAFDVAQRTPNLLISTNSAMGQPYIRGIGSDALGVGTESSTTMHLDGVYISRGAATLMDFVDIERIEVLRGPQGTLYGRNSVGGTINVITRKPANDFEANATLDLGNYDLRRLRGVINIPLGNDTAIRISGLRSLHEGFFTNVNPQGQRRLQDEDVAAGRIAFRTAPADNLEFLLSGDWYRGRGTGLVNKPLEPGTSGAFGGVVFPQPFVTDTPLHHFQNEDFRGLQSQVNLTLEKVRVSLITGYRKTVWKNAVDSDGTRAAVLNLLWGENHDQASAELQFASVPGTRLEWVGGLYYIHENGTFHALLDFPIAGFSVLDIGKDRTNAYAAYGQATYPITPTVKLTAGIRYSIEHKTADTALFLGSTPLGEAPGAKTWHAWTPKFVIQYEPTRRLDFYLSASKGFKSGGFNSAGLQGPFDPETLWAYEGGVKMRLFRDKLNLNTAAFHYDYQNLQVVKFANNLTITTNAARAKVDGVELEATANPLTGLQIGGNAAYLNARYTQYVTGDPARPQLGQLNLAGNPLTRAPRYSAGLFGRWAIPLGLDEILLLGEYNWRSRSYFSPFKDKAISQSPLGIINARITFHPKDDRWSAALWGKNLSNRTVYGSLFRFDSTGFNAVAQLREPRTYGVEFGARF